MSNSELPMLYRILSAEVRAGYFTDTNRVRDRFVELLRRYHIVCDPEHPCVYERIPGVVRNGRIDLYFEYQGRKYYIEFDKTFNNTKSVLKLMRMRRRYKDSVCLIIACSFKTGVLTWKHY